MRFYRDYIIGSLPLGFRMPGWSTCAGDKEKGIRTVQKVASRGKINRMDAQILLCAVYRHENTPKLAIPLVRSSYGATRAITF